MLSKLAKFAKKQSDQPNSKQSKKKNPQKYLQIF